MDDIERLKEAIGSAKRIVAFTGAGISTESGIPDFRSPGGIWTKYKPIYFDDFMCRCWCWWARCGQGPPRGGSKTRRC
jgi:hypothetical protein